MPIYEYRCQSCETEFEDLVRLGTPDEDIECPSCGEHNATRLLSVFANQSKGPAVATGSSSCGPSGFS